MEEEDQHHERDRYRFFDELVLEILHSPLDQRRAIVDWNDLHALRQAGRQFVDAFGHPVDDFESVLAVAHHDDARDHLALAIELGHAAPQRRSFDDPAKIGDGHRSAVFGVERDLLKLSGRGHIASRAHEKFGLGLLDDAAACFKRRPAHRFDHFRKRHAERAQSVRIKEHLKLALKAPDRGDLRHAVHGGEFKAQEPVLKGAQIGEVALARAVHQGVLIDPADTCGVGTELRRRAGGQFGLHARERLEHAGARPILIHPVLEHHVDEGGTEHGDAAHVLCPRQAQQRARHRIGDEVFDQLRALAGKLGAYDDLGVGHVRHRVERRGLDRANPADQQYHRADQDQELVLDRPGDKAGDPALGRVAKPGVSGLHDPPRRASCLRSCLRLVHAPARPLATSPVSRLHRRRG